MNCMLVSSHALDNLWGETILFVCHVQKLVTNIMSYENIINQI